MSESSHVTTHASSENETENTTSTDTGATSEEVNSHTGSHSESETPQESIDIPTKNVRDKLCDFYMSAKGCIKGDACDFHHPRAPNGTITNRVCEYYLQPRGCVKGEDCDFLHPQQRLRQGIRGGVATGYKSTRPCEFFFSQRGCVKGDDCDYSHINMAFINGPGPYYRGPPIRYPPPYGVPRFPPFIGYPGMIPPHIPPMGMGGMGMPPQRPQPCSFYNTEKGCIKGIHCDFIHQKNKICDFFNSERGCRKGKYCDYLHTYDAPLTNGNTITRPIPGYFTPYHHHHHHHHDLSTSNGQPTTTSQEHAQAHHVQNNTQIVAVEAAS